MTASRNDSCPCGSGRRFKHCCGRPNANNDPYAHLTDDALLALAKWVDDDALAAGEDPPRRHFNNVLRMLTALGIDGVVVAGRNEPAIVTRIKVAVDRLFRPSDRSRTIHLGAVMFRDLFFQFRVPLVFGAPVLNFYDCTDLNRDQMWWLEADRAAAARFDDQARDLMDFGYGWMEFGHGETEKPHAYGVELVSRARDQLLTAAVTLTSGANFGGAVQNALLGAELALKGGLASLGVSARDLKAFGHDRLGDAAVKLGQMRPSFDAARVARACATFPSLVGNRYTDPPPSRVDTGGIVMRAQFIAAEVTRQFSPRNSFAPSHLPRNFPE